MCEWYEINVYDGSGNTIYNGLERFRRKNDAVKKAKEYKNKYKEYIVYVDHIAHDEIQDDYILIK